MPINKIEAAKQQLETAIKLFKEDEDPISTHTLAAAAYNVLVDLSKSRQETYQSIRDIILERVKTEKKREVINTFRSAENFFKHADNDPEASLEFNSNQTIIIILDAVIFYQKLTQDTTLSFRVFYKWAYYTQDFFIMPEELAESFEEVREIESLLTKKELFALIERLEPA